MIRTDYTYWRYSSKKYFSGNHTVDDDVIYHFDSISLELRVTGTYYEYLPGVESDIAGLYFVFGLNKEVIKNQDFFIPELIERKNTNKVLGNKILLDVNCVKIDFNNPMKSFEDFMTILRGMIAVQFFCRNICNMPYPDALPEEMINTLLKLHTMIKIQESNSKAEKMYLMDVLYMGANIISSYVKSQKYSVLEKLFCKENFFHKIELLRTKKAIAKNIKSSYSGDLSTLKVPYQVWDKFKAEVSAYPELFYYKRKREKFDANNFIFSVKNDYQDLVNCRHDYYVISVPTPYLAKFSFIMHNCVFENYGTLQANDIINNGESFGAFYIPYYFYYEFTDMAKRNKIDYAMDKQYVLASKPDCVPILVPHKDIKRVNTILNTYQSDDIERDYTHGKITQNNTYYLEEYETGDILPKINDVPFVHISSISAPYRYSKENLSERKHSFAKYLAECDKAYKKAEKDLDLRTLKIDK